MKNIESIPVVFISGPFRGKNHWDIENNIRRAEELALKVWRLGAAALCPHTNTRFFEGAAPDDIWLDGDLALLLRCDALITTDDWDRSSGARTEVEFCDKHNILIFHSVVDLEKWVKNYKNRIAVGE